MKMQLRLGIAMLTLILALHPCSADAVVITFVEGPNESSEVTTSVDLAGCAGCTKLPEIGLVERGVTGFTFPAGFFPADILPGTQAILVNPNIPGEDAGAISDTVLLEISTAGRFVLANFISDTEGVITFPHEGVGVVETGGLQTLDGHFFREDPATGMVVPVALPAALTIKVQSEVVPEPSTLLLVGTGVAGLACAARKRHRRSNEKRP